MADAYAKLTAASGTVDPCILLEARPAVSSREEILRRIRSAPAALRTVPQPFSAGIEFDDPVAQFSEVLRSVGGRCEAVATTDVMESLLRVLVEQVGARNICSLGIGDEGSALTTFDLAGIQDSHELEGVDLAILPGKLAVAENGAVWTTAASSIERTLYFLTQHLVLIVPHEQVVSNLHQAYARLDVAALPFGCWISGPSKTADIEQSLVLGAHGPRSLLVLLTGSG